jgi:hypothetical protein
MPSHELTKILYSSLENTPNSILPRRHVRSCIDLSVSSVAAWMANACRTIEGVSDTPGSNLKPNHSNVHSRRDASDA